MSVLSFFITSLCSIYLKLRKLKSNYILSEIKNIFIYPCLKKKKCRNCVIEQNFLIQFSGNLIFEQKKIYPNKNYNYF